MISSAVRKMALLIAIAAAVGLIASVTSAGASEAGGVQHRQVGAATLSRFRVVLTATRGPGSPPLATVTAAGFRRSAGHWKLISRKRIGKPNQWLWFSVDTCSLTITQLAGVSPNRISRSIRVRLLVTPSIGCTPAFVKRWP